MTAGLVPITTTMWQLLMTEEVIKVGRHSYNSEQIILTSQLNCHGFTTVTCWRSANCCTPWERKLTFHCTNVYKRYNLPMNKNFVRHSVWRCFIWCLFKWNEQTVLILRPKLVLPVWRWLFFPEEANVSQAETKSSARDRLVTNLNQTEHQTAKITCS